MKFSNDKIYSLAVDRQDLGKIGDLFRVYWNIGMLSYEVSKYEIFDGDVDLEIVGYFSKKKLGNDLLDLYPFLKLNKQPIPYSGLKQLVEDAGGNPVIAYFLNQVVFWASLVAVKGPAVALLLHDGKWIEFEYPAGVCLNVQLYSIDAKPSPQKKRKGKSLFNKAMEEMLSQNQNK